MSHLKWRYQKSLLSIKINIQGLFWTSLNNCSNCCTFEYSSTHRNSETNSLLIRVHSYFFHLQKHTYRPCIWSFFEFQFLKSWLRVCFPSLLTELVSLICLIMPLTFRSAVGRKFCLTVWLINLFYTVRIDGNGHFTWCARYLRIMRYNHNI